MSWLETAYGNAGRGAASEFAVQPPPGELAMAEVALEAAMKGERPVLLAASSPIECVVAGLVFKRAGLTLEQVFQGSFTDDQFERLAGVLMEIKASKLMVELPPERVALWDTSMI